MRPTRACLAALLLLLPTACGGEVSSADAVDAGYSSLNAGSYTEAMESFDSALTGLSSTDDGYLSAKLGHIQAQCHVDPTKAKDALLGLDKASGVKASDYSMIVSEFISAASSQASDDADGASATMGEAVAILTAGKEAFPEYTKWDALLKKAGDKAASLGSADALEALKGLGYVGGD